MIAPVESVTTPPSEASPCAQAVPGASARSNKNKLAIDFQATLLVSTRVIESLLISANSLVHRRTGAAPAKKFLAQKQTPKRKIPPPERVWRWDSRIARFMIRYLELQPPGARRHTCTARTTETSLHGLLDVVIHTQRTVPEEIPDVKFISAQNLDFDEISGTYSAYK
jgi:hypothetical protein